MTAQAWKRTSFRAAVILLVVIAAHSPALRAGFIWDDKDHLTENPCIVGPLGLKEIWTTTRAIYYPLVLTTFWALHKIVGLNPLPYHLLNLVMHSGSALLLWHVLRVLKVRAAWFGALLWAVHPVTVQSVAWVSELKNTQSCFFYLLSIALFLKGDEQRDVNHKTFLALFALSVMVFALAITSKPATVMLPVVLALCLWWRKRTLQRRDLILLVPFLVIACAAAGWTVYEQRFHSGAIGPDWDLTAAQRLVVAGRDVWFYLAKVIWPHPLLFIYPRWKIGPVRLVDFLPLWAAIAGFFFLWLKRNGRPLRPAFFAAAYFVVSLFPVLGFFNVFFFMYSFVSDHFQYLACIGPVSLAASTGAFAIRAPHLSKFQGMLGAGVVLVLGTLTWGQAMTYRDAETLYHTMIQRDPNSWMAEFNLGMILIQRQQTDTGIDFLRRAAIQRPTDAMANTGLAFALLRSGRIDEAITYYEKALSADPNYLPAHVGLASSLQENNETDQAIAHYKKALDLEPRATQIHQDLAILLFEQGRLDDALSHIQETLEVQPGNANAHIILGNMLMAKKSIDNAIMEYLKAVELEPDNPDAHYNLSKAFSEKGLTDLARKHYERALQLERPQ